MLVEEAIRSRASIKVFSDEPVAPAVIERCLEAAVWAPNHHLTEPWQFRVIAGEMRELLAQTVKASMLHDATGLDVAGAVIDSLARALPRPRRRRKAA